MMIIGVLTDPGVGGTFLSWSLHYLSGHKEYFCASQCKMVNVPDNPLAAINAHNFLTNQPNSLKEFEKMINLIQKNNLYEVHTVYFHNFKRKEVELPYHKDTADAISELQTITNKLVILSVSENHKLYFSKFEGRVLHKKFNSEELYNKDFNEQHNDFIDTFFNESKKQWEDLGLTNSWDYREFLALNIRPYEVDSILPNINLSTPHYLLDTFDLYNHFETTVFSLFRYLELDIDSKRWEQWTTVYRQWRIMHLDRILFAKYFDIIINSIINNHYLELERFNLDIIREATILHALIYKHNLSIRGWGLDKFPNNTQDLHKLLEKNTFHKVKNIYGVNI